MGDMLGDLDSGFLSYWNLTIFVVKSPGSIA